MTMTIKLAPDMEQRLRQRSVALGQPASALIREALAAYLAADVPAQMSAYALGADLFGRHRGAPDLADNRKAHLVDVLTEQHRARRG
jgi:predicted DNA-binding protein